MARAGENSRVNEALTSQSCWKRGTEDHEKAGEAGDSVAGRLDDDAVVH